MERKRPMHCSSRQAFLWPSMKNVSDLLDITSAFTISSSSMLPPEKKEETSQLPDVLDEFYHLESHLDTVVRMHGICIRHPRNAVVAITQDLDSHAFVHLEFENCRQSFLAGLACLTQCCLLSK